MKWEYYIADINYNYYIPDIQLKLYADDTVFYLRAPIIVEANTIMNESANKFNTWCEFNKLTVNLQKSKCILFSSRAAHSHKAQKDLVNIRICNVKLDLVDQYKYLGVILDDRLSFIKHINYLISLISHRLYILRKIRYYIDEGTALLLFKTMILSYFDLGNIFYDSCNKNMLKRLQTLQNSALRCVYCNSKLSIEEMHSRSNLLLLTDRRALDQCTSVHKHNIENFEYNNTKRRVLRSSNLITLIVPKIRNGTFERSFIFKGIKYWNSLPEHCKRIPIDEPKLFKLRVRKEMLINKFNFPE